MITKDPFHIRLYRKLLLIFARYIPDKLFLTQIFPLYTGYKLNLDNPKSFNEKLQWLKLNNIKPEYTKMVDKVEAKKYAANIIGEEYIIPTIAVYDKAEDIDFGSLPNQFVLKCTHDSGGIVICTDKSKLDKKKTVNRLRKGLRINYFFQNREWPYKNVVPRIIAEPYMEDKEFQELRDYKFMCYNGTCKNIFVCSGRAKGDLRVDFYDTEWNHLPFYRKYQNSDYIIKKPVLLKEMIGLSETLARNIDSQFVRIDMYSISGRIYFGEITFFPGSGFEKFSPREWDDNLGELLILS